MPVKIALVEDNRINRNTFSGKTGSFDDLVTVFIAGNGVDALHKLKEMNKEERPQLIFVDIEMPVMNGIQFIQLARLLYPEICFIILTIFDDEEKIFEAIRAGANGYLLKDATAQGLRHAITDALEQGGAPMSPPIARKALELLGRSTSKSGNPKEENTAQKDDREKEGSLEDLLSKREKEILQSMIRGASPKQIAEALFISLTTVRKHIANIYRKLHVNTNRQIMSLAYKNNWI